MVCIKKKRRNKEGREGRGNEEKRGLMNNKIVQRGLVYEMELQVLLGWLTETGKTKPPKKDVPPSQIPIKTDLSKAVLAQALVDVLKKPDAPPFTLTPMQICVGLTGDALDCVLQLAKDNKIKIFDEIDPKVPLSFLFFFFLLLFSPHFYIFTHVFE